MTKYYIGTAGWSYKDWVPSFYPKQQSAGFDWLRFYSHYFNCVEVNSSYYAYIDPRVVNGWIEKVNDAEEFVFTMKLHQDFTHIRNFDDDKVRSVTYNLDLLAKAGRLGGLLIQFPYSFSYSDAAGNYLRQLSETFQQFNCFTEVRHKSWMNKQAMEVFSRYNLIYCTVDQPQIGEAIPFEPQLTNGKGYIRFHGRNTEEWMNSIKSFGSKQTYDQQSARYKYLYSPGELVEMAQKIQSVERAAKEIYIIMNNHPAGYAVANAFEMIHLLEQKAGIDIPLNTLNIFQRLKQISSRAS
jgi:uncharacterized protein YecE (DUF72 family)